MQETNDFDDDGYAAAHQKELEETQRVELVIPRGKKYYDVVEKGHLISNPLITLEELIMALREIGETAHDPEDAHIAADKLMLAYINDERVTEAFESINKWYA